MSLSVYWYIRIFQVPNLTKFWCMLPEAIIHYLLLVLWIRSCIQLMGPLQYYVYMLKIRQQFHLE